MPPCPYPWHLDSSYWADPSSSSPVPFFIARSMLSLGRLTPLALSIARASLGLPPGSPPPSRAAMVISRICRVKTFARLASSLAFLWRMFAHFECPAITDQFRVVPMNQCNNIVKRQMLSNRNESDNPAVGKETEDSRYVSPR